ncbi:MAG: hypothetical protein H0U87_00175 [Acidobacteria bacterium]|nr:hypothetical protein [Acidobacteriota bacterium]
MTEHLIQIEDAQNNLLDCAAFVAEKIDNRSGYGAAMNKIVPRYLEKNAVDLAAQLADAVEDPFDRDRLLSAVAGKCAATGDEEYAFQLVESIEDKGLRGAALEVIAVEKAEAGDFERAHEIAASLEHSSHALGIVAYRLTVAGRAGEAAQALERIEFPASKVNALQLIAEHYEKNNQPEKAVETLEKANAAAMEIDFPEEKIGVLQSVADSFARVGRADKSIELFERARQAAEQIKGVYRDAALAEIAQGFMRAGSVELADRTLDAVTDLTQTARCLYGFSQTFREKGERKDALDALGESYAFLKSQTEAKIRDRRAYFNLLSAVAAQFAEFDKPERALEIAHEILNRSGDVSAFSQIAQIFARQPNKNELMRQAIDAVFDDGQKLLALVNASDEKNRQVKRAEAVELLREAATLTDGVQNIAERSGVFNELAKRFAAYGERERAREILRENLDLITHFGDATIRSVALADLSEVFETANFELNEAEKSILQTIIRRAAW